MFRDKQRKREVLLGFLMFSTGSLVFWWLISKNTNPELEFLKAAYFIGLLAISAFLILEKIAAKFKTKTKTIDKVKLALLFFLLVLAVYFASIFILERF